MINWTIWRIMFWLRFSLCANLIFVFFFVYKTFLKSEEQYFLPTKNKDSVCREVISEWMDKAAMTVQEMGPETLKSVFLTKLLNMLHCLDERHSKECSITLKINRQNKIYLPESQ